MPAWMDLSGPGQHTKALNDNAHDVTIFMCVCRRAEETRHKESERETGRLRRDDMHPEPDLADIVLLGARALALGSRTNAITARCCTPLYLD